MYLTQKMEENSNNGSDHHAEVKQVSTGIILKGEDAPLVSELEEWLEMHQE